MNRVALDSNILIYLAETARAPGDFEKIASANRLVDALSARATIVVPVQALGEAFVVMKRSGISSEKAREAIGDFAEAFTVAPSREAAALAAADLVVDHKLQFWDAMVVSAAADAGCSLLLSEDMQHGFVVRGLTVVNPLADEVHPKLAALLQAS